MQEIFKLIRDMREVIQNYEMLDDEEKARFMVILDKFEKKVDKFYDSLI